MAYQFNLKGIPITCDTLEELLGAVSAGLADIRSSGQAVVEHHATQAAPQHASQGSQGSPQVVVVAPTQIDPPQRTKRREGKPQGSGPKRAWAEAEDYAKANGISTGEARSILARMKREAAQNAVRAVEERLKGKKK